MPIVLQRYFVYQRVGWLAACMYQCRVHLFAVHPDRLQLVKSVEIASEKAGSISSMCFMREGDIWFGGEKWVKKISFQ